MCDSHIDMTVTLIKGGDHGGGQEAESGDPIPSLVQIPEGFPIPDARSPRSRCGTDKAPAREKGRDGFQAPTWDLSNWTSIGATIGLP